MRNERGITLVETMVSLAVLAAGLLLFLQATALSLHLHERSRRVSEALFLAQGKMEVLTAEGWAGAVAEGAGEGGPGAGADTFTKEILLRGVSFRLVLERTDVEPGLEHYRVSCFWKDGAGEYRSRNSVRLLGARGRHP